LTWYTYCRVVLPVAEPNSGVLVASTVAALASATTVYTVRALKARTTNVTAHTPGAVVLLGLHGELM
jgi:hypothetical protein